MIGSLDGLRLFVLVKVFTVVFVLSHLLRRTLKKKKRKKNTFHVACEQAFWSGDKAERKAELKLDMRGMS